LRSLTARIGAITVALAILCAAAACAHGPQVAIVGAEGSDRAAVRVELATTPAERELGLMYRHHLDADAGMLFIFPTQDHVSFWMRNTEIPLDMIFADSSGRIVGIVVNAVPYSEDSLGPNADSQYVLEVNGGFCAAHHVATGDRMRFIGFKPSTNS